MDDYWLLRSQERKHIREQLQRENGYSAIIKEQYTQAMSEIMQTIDAEVLNFAKDANIDIKEAQKRIKKFDVDAFKMKAERYVEQGKRGPNVDRWMAEFEVTQRTSRLQYLNKMIELETIRLADVEEYETRKMLENEAMIELERQAGIHRMSIPTPNQLRQRAMVIADAEFHGKHFSDRVWENQKELQRNLERTIRGNILQGKSPLEFVADLRTNVAKEFANKTYAARRIAITEVARVQTTAQEESFKEFGFEEYMFIAEPGACEICGVLDGEVFKVSDMTSGVNAPTMHPFCKCSTAAYYNRSELDARLNEINAGTVETDNSSADEIFVPDKESDIYVNLGEKHYNDVRKIIDDSDHDITKLWNKYESEFEVENVKRRGQGAWYSPHEGEGVNMNLNSVAKGDWYTKPHGTTIHEFAHNLDHVLGKNDNDPLTMYSQIYQDGILGKTLNEEAMNYVKAVQKTNDVKRAQAYNLVSSEIKDLNPFEAADISDLFEGATNAKVNGGFGHGKSYWGPASDHGKVASEAFAEFTDATLNNPESLVQIKKYFPESYKIWEKMIGEIL